MLWSAILLAISLFLSFASPSALTMTSRLVIPQATQCFPHLRAALGLPSASTNWGETGARSGAAASTTIGGTSTEYQVDADGFLVKKVLADGATWKYVWDAHGQLSEVERPDGERVAFTYDAFGRRTSKTVGGKTTEYVWDGDDLVHERVRDAASGVVTAPITTWVFEPGTFTPLAKLEGRKRYGVVTDHLGSPTMLATEAGKIAWRAQLDVYGVPREEPGVAAGSGAGAGGVGAASDATANPWRFPGQYEDAETGLFYNRFRYYDPELGRYLSEDPIGVAGGVALFGYVHEPLGWVDWFGLSCVKSNRAAGKAAEAYVEDAIRVLRPDLQLLGRQVTINTAKGKRVIDLLYQGSDDIIYAVEVKAGGATRSAAQKAKDALIDAGAGVFVGEKAGDLAGKSTQNVAVLVLGGV